VTADPTNSVVPGRIGRRWGAVRGALLAAAVLCLVMAVMLHPAAAARYLSDDGVLAPSSRRALSTASAGLAATAAALLLVWWSWRTPTLRRERVVLGCAAIAGSLLISAVGAEAGLSAVHRFVKPLTAERHYFFAYDPVLGWKHRPGSRATFKQAVVRIDADGLRVSGHERGPFHSRVVLLGDSQAFGDGVTAEDTFAARLEADIPGLRVFNASVIGYGTDQQLIYFEQHGRRYAPGVTVVALNAYDLHDNLSTRVRSGYAKPRFIATPEGLKLTNTPVPGGGLVDRLHSGLQYHSRLYGLLTRMWRSRGRQLEDDADVSTGRRLALEVYPDRAHVERGLAITAAILDRLAHSAAEAGSRLIVLFLPYQMDFTDPEAYGAHTERLVRDLQQRAARGSYAFVDGRRALAVGPPEQMFRDAMHLSPAGHRRIAAAIEETLFAEKLVSRSYASGNRD
jgi:hypothetical protein